MQKKHYDQVSASVLEDRKAKIIST